MQNYNWRPIPEFEGLYEIKETSQIRSLHKRKYKQPIAQNVDGEGYYHVKLSKNGKQYTRSVHRLVALTFIPNPENKEEVNHIDANKLNNHVTNLEWCTHAENIRHAFKLGLIPRKKIKVLDRCTGKVFSCSKEAAEFYGINHRTMRNYLSGNIKTNPTCAEYLRDAA